MTALGTQAPRATVAQGPERRSRQRRRNLVTNLKGELVKLRDKSSRDLDSAIKKANAKEADVSRDDFDFWDWKPGKDWTCS